MSKGLGLLLAAIIAVGGIHSLVTFGQDAAPAKAKTQSNRLPAYYKDVVNDEQKLKIYGIQDKYKDRISALAEQVKKLQAERNAEIEAVLTAEQKTKLAEVKTIAEKKKAEAAAAIKAAAEKKPAATEVKVDPAAVAPAAPVAVPKPITPATTVKPATK